MFISKLTSILEYIHISFTHNHKDEKKIFVTKTVVEKGASTSSI